MPNPSPIHVLCATNAAYAMPLAVMLTSLVYHFKGTRDLLLHIFQFDIPNDLREKVKTSVRQNRTGSYRLEFHWTKLDLALFKDIPDHSSGPKYISQETYSRLVAPDLLPPECARDLPRLRPRRAQGHLHPGRFRRRSALPLRRRGGRLSLRLVVPLQQLRAVIFNYAELGIPATRPYFNAGVMVINLPRWRELKVSARVVAYLEQHREKSLYHDQGALNAVLHDQWSAIEPRWNWILFNPENWKPPAFSLADWRKVMRDPCIVHFAGSDKPWKPSFNRPRFSYFRRYLFKTLFKDEVKMPSSARLESIIGCGNYYRLWKFKRQLAALFAKR